MTNLNSRETQGDQGCDPVKNVTIHVCPRTDTSSSRHVKNTEPVIRENMIHKTMIDIIQITILNNGALKDKTLKVFGLVFLFGLP